MKKYIDIINGSRDATKLKIELYYNLGGYNCFTHKEEPRGYYVSVSPVEHSSIGGVMMESYAAYSGVKRCVKPVSRKSAKAEKDAEQIAPEIIRDLITYVCNKNGFIIEDYTI